MLHHFYFIERTMSHMVSYKIIINNFFIFILIYQWKIMKAIDLKNNFNSNNKITVKLVNLNEINYFHDLVNYNR